MGKLPARGVGGERQSYTIPAFLGSWPKSLCFPELSSVLNAHGLMGDTVGGWVDAAMRTVPPRSLDPH